MSSREWTVPLALLGAVLASARAAEAAPRSTPPRVERVTTVAPFPRGLAMVEGRLYVLCRGRVRGAGGVTAEIDDQAGTIYAVDPEISEPISLSEPGLAVRTNGRLLTRATTPPFRLWDRTARPPSADRVTDRPYCTLRYHGPTDSFYICAFSGIDRPRTPEDPIAFSKNRSDAILRYDRRTGRWHEIERHRLEAPHAYPHHDPESFPPPHGWLEGPDNCLALGSWLYAVSKDNSRLVRYDLRDLEREPEAGCPASELVLGADVEVEGHGRRRFEGQSALAFHEGMLYIAYRTSSVIIRIPFDERLQPRTPIVAELVARFEPYDPLTGHSANLTDMAFDEAGRLYVVSAQPARVYRFRPDPAHVFDGEGAQPWVDLAALTGNPHMKCENLLTHGPWLYVTSGDGYGYQHGADGTVYRVAID